MAAKKKTQKKTSPKKGSQKSGGTATLDPKTETDTPEVTVEILPKGQTRAKDGTVILKNGEHLGLVKANYEVHGSRLELEGDVFVAQQDVNWIPVAKCTCKSDRPDPIELRKLKDGKWAVIGSCNNKKCQYSGKRYVWICPANRFSV